MAKTRECSTSKNGQHKRVMMTEERFDSSGEIEALFYCVICDACMKTLVEWSVSRR